MIGREKIEVRKESNLDPVTPKLMYESEEIDLARGQTCCCPWVEISDEERRGSWTPGVEKMLGT